MKAIWFEEHGGPEVVQFGERPDPVCGKNDVVVQIKASAINPNGYWARIGVNGKTFPLPMIPGSDAAGIVVEVGPNVAHVKTGDEVSIYCGVACHSCFRCMNGEEHICKQKGGFRIWGFDTPNGGHAEYVAIEAYNVVPKPRNLSFEEAASLPLTLVTAWHMLVRNAKVEANDIVLVRGAAGGTGCMASQICRIHGAISIGVASNEKKAQIAKELGCDYVIIRPRGGSEEQERERSKRFLKELHDITMTYNRWGVDYVFDHVGGPSLMESIAALRHGGAIVTCGATSGYATHVELAPVFIQNKSIIGSTLGTKAELLEAFRCVERGMIKPFVAEVIPLSDVAAGQERLRLGQSVGKIVVGR